MKYLTLITACLILSSCAIDEESSSPYFIDGAITKVLKCSEAICTVIVQTELGEKEWEAWEPAIIGQSVYKRCEKYRGRTYCGTVADR